jgi:hypothetical protein
MHNRVEATNELARRSDVKNGLSGMNTIKIVTQKVRSNSKGIWISSSSC